MEFRYKERSESEFSFKVKPPCPPPASKPKPSESPSPKPSESPSPKPEPSPRITGAQKMGYSTETDTLDGSTSFREPFREPFQEPPIGFDGFTESGFGFESGFLSSSSSVGDPLSLSSNSNIFENVDTVIKGFTDFDFLGVF